jgi:hypothetical protein
VARGRAARRSGRGGDRIPATRAPGPRLIVSLAALALAAALAAVPVLRADRLDGLFLAAGGVAVAVLGYGLARGRASAVPWTLLLLGAAYGGALFLPERGVDEDAPLLALGFVLLAELSYWALELRTPLTSEPGMLVRRAAIVAAAALGALVVAVLSIAATAVPLGGGVLWDAVGVLAAAAVLLIVARLAEREA